MAFALRCSMRILPAHPWPTALRHGAFEVRAISPATICSCLGNPRGSRCGVARWRGAHRDDLGPPFSPWGSGFDDRQPVGWLKSLHNPGISGRLIPAATIGTMVYREPNNAHCPDSPSA